MKKLGFGFMRLPMNGEEVDITTNYDEDLTDARMALPASDEMPVTTTNTGNYLSEYEDDFGLSDEDDSDDDDDSYLDSLDLPGTDDDETLYDGTLSGEENNDNE
jgi:hypothetical protein